MNKRIITALLFWCLGLIALVVTLDLTGSGQLYDSVIRLHVLANSDSEEDQAIKLAVRDEVLAYCQNKFSLSDRESAEQELASDLTGIREAAIAKLRELGQEDSVDVTLSRESYPTRHYEGLSLPCGTYTSLKVSIGKASGKNWWCVLFPPLCLNSAVETESALLRGGMDERDVKTVTLDGAKYEIRFKILEWFYALRGKNNGEI
ncbi:MAG: stage II sporulation protein R [Clostridia bacterium]|nr:stage II sporulation protein R [Clostridia bacterium]